MDGGVVRLILAAIAAVMILCVSVSGTDLTIVLLGGIALVLIRRTHSDHHKNQRPRGGGRRELHEHDPIRFPHRPERAEGVS